MLKKDYSKKCEECQRTIYILKEPHIIVSKYVEYYFCSILCFLMSGRVRYFQEYEKILFKFLQNDNAKLYPEYTYLKKVYKKLYHPKKC